MIRNRMRLTKQESEATFNRTGNIVRIDVVSSARRVMVEADHKSFIAFHKDEE